MTILYDGYGAPITSTIHEPIPLKHHGTYGDRPTPWQVSYECVCGADLECMDEEGGLYGDVDAAMTEHLEGLGLADCGDGGAA
ncbi:hypothetical protein NLU66_16660 [Brachybacterium sp. NBEC-018]|uniref:hypothetical protein n=1 Tax=Brachybacterium sp. NBEC-018 TaxID=2996004 RepID=UPI002174F889|nr:hypothetical protein [Brachybacterium sp. NBEC-018]UVY83820.1 hypothetical protein NLU66_16660 [Brachybacterium sp. NBEC-018]